MALPNLDNFPVSYLTINIKNKPLEVPIVIQTWLTNLVDTMNEALLEIERRLIAGGL